MQEPLEQPEQSEQPQADGEWQLHWGQLLRAARQVAGLSLAELSAATGLSKGYLSKLESGHANAHNPSRATLAALARALPSFRPLARTLEPASSLGLLAFGETGRERPEIVLSANTTAIQAPVRLGWRELEAVIALLTLERSAVAQPLTAVVLARAIGRPLAQVRPVLERLITMRVLDDQPPTWLGGQTTYQRSVDFEERVGLTRLGDALVLAAALLAQSGQPERQRTIPELTSTDDRRSAS